MQMIDLKSKLKEFMEDPQRSINQAHLNGICKIGKKEKTCRYIFSVGDTYLCTRKTPVKDIIDGLVKANQMISKGDNCDGLGKLIRKINDK